MTGSGRFRRAILGGLVVGLLCAGSARAAITGSSIAQPADPSFLVADDDSGSSTVNISGTTSGGAPGTDKVDIRCYYNDNADSYLVRSGVSTNPDGTFSTIGNLGGIDDAVCVLRAIPASSFPSDVTAFTGPRVATGERQSFFIATGMNAGATYDFFMWGQQLTAAFDYHSLTRCGIYDGYLYDAALNITTFTFACNDFFDISNDPSPTRSGLVIDGASAYGAYSAQDINSLASGYAPVTYSYSVDPANGNMVIHETEQLVKCPDTTYPPTAVKCPSFVTTGVSDTRTITQDHDGHLSTVSDTFSSTDGQSHALDLLWENDQTFQKLGSGDARNIAYEFPGESAFAKHAPPDNITLPATPGTILIHVDGAADGDHSTGQGAIVYDRPADFAKFIYADAFVEEFNLHQTGTVPAGGSTTFTTAYAQDYTSAGVTALAGAVADGFSPPAVTISSPANGTVVHTPSVTVSGTATDNVGVTSLTVGGHAVAVGAGGPWSTTVALNAGANAITAVAHDAAGGTGQAQIALTYTPLAPPPSKPGCRVPKLKGKTLKAAKKALKKAHCGVGKVTRKRSKAVRKGRVISSKPKAGKKLARGAKVALTVAR